MPKVLWIGDAGSHTGFATATHAIGERLVDLGHEVSVLAVNHRGDSEPSKMRLYSASAKQSGDMYGLSRVVELLGDVEPDVVVMLNDPFICLTYIFGNQFDPEMVLLKYRPLVTYQPRDGYDPPSKWDALRAVPVKDAELPVSRQVAMSKFGQEQMPGSDLVYHGVDTITFHPASRENPVRTREGHVITSKRQAKEAFGYPPDSFLVLRADRNSLRKDFASTWKALVPVMKRHSDILVHFHCSGSDSAAGVQMPSLWTRDMETAGRFKLSDGIDTWKGWPVENVVALYNAADLFVTTSQGEGFGLTIAESLACGTPVVAQRVSSIPEVVGPGGMIVEPGAMTTAPGGQDMHLADIPAFTEAIEHLYLNQGFRKRYAKAGLQHVTETFSWDAAAVGFDRIIREEAAKLDEVAATA